MTLTHSGVALAMLLLATNAQAATAPALFAGGSADSVEIQGFLYDSDKPSNARLDTESKTPGGALVRWGEPASPRQAPRLEFIDGSVLVSDKGWSASSLVALDASKVKIRRAKGWTTVDRSTVRLAVLDPQAAISVGPQLADDSVVYFRDGDRLETRVESLESDKLLASVAGNAVELEAGRIAAIGFGGEPANPTAPCCLVGLTDGSLVRAKKVRADSAWLIVGAEAGYTLRLSADQLAFLQPLGGKAEYLSDREPIDYRHTPYFDLAWPYARDQAIQGGPLAGGGRRAAKGLAMHSAARLVYRLDGAPRRFQAELAIADPAFNNPAISGPVTPDQRAEGSVVFRVYLVRDGAFEPAYESPIIRSGDPPQPIDLDTTGAAGLALVVDYADRADTGDHALWLDARLVSE